VIKMRVKKLLVIAALASVPGAASHSRRSLRKSRGRPAAPSPADGLEQIDCKKCMSQVMRLLVPGTRGCPAGNGTLIPSSTPQRVPTAYCTTLLPKKRQCVAFSFGIDGVWDFDNILSKQSSCRVLSFDPFCCGAAHRVSADHDFIPVGLATYDGLSQSDVSHGNVSYPVMMLKTIMDSWEQPKVDLLRLKVSSMLEWKGLKNLINLGTIQDIRQLSLNIHFADDTMWEEYKIILSGLKSAGFVPFYVAKQPNAEYLKVQEGTQSLHSRYEVAYGNTYHA